MTDWQARSWKETRTRGLAPYCIAQAARMGAYVCLVATLVGTISGRFPDIKSGWPMMALAMGLWGFFAIGLWHKNEFAYLRLASGGRGLSPADDRR